MWLGCGLLPAWAVWQRARAATAGPGLSLAAATATGALILLYAPAAVYARTVLLDLPLTFLVTLAVSVLVAASPPRRADLVIAAVALGLAATLRAHVLILAPGLILLAWRTLPRHRPRPAWLALVSILALGPMLIFAGHNSLHAGRLVGPSLNSGVNLYLGLQQDTGGFFANLRGFRQADDPSGEAFLEERLQRPLDGPADADAAWRGEAWRRWRDAPGAATRGWFRKVWLHLQAAEVAQVTPLDRWPDAAPVLRWLPVRWSALVALGLTAAIWLLALNRTATASPWRQPALLVLAVVALLIATQSLFFVTSRYRLVLAPLLALLAGLGLLSLPRAGRRAWLAVPVLLIVILATRPWGLAAAQAHWQGLQDRQLAARLEMLADHTGQDHLREQAADLLAEASVATPWRAQAWADRARNLVRLGRLEAAEESMAEFLRLHPDNPDMLHDLAVLQGQRGHWEAVEATAGRLQRAAPGDARGWIDQAQAQFRQGRPEAAATTLRRGLDRVTDAEGRRMLEVNLARLEDPSSRR
jgi:tetratricopeptide (TPR) repeat protein